MINMRRILITKLYDAIFMFYNKIFYSRLQCTKVSRIILHLLETNMLFYRLRYSRPKKKKKEKGRKEKKKERIRRKGKKKNRGQVEKWEIGVEPEVQPATLSASRSWNDA